MKLIPEIKDGTIIEVNGKRYEVLDIVEPSPDGDFDGEVTFKELYEEARGVTEKVFWLYVYAFVLWWGLVVVLINLFV